MQRLSFSAFTANRPTDDLSAHLLRWLKTYPEQRLPPVREICQALKISSRDVVMHLDELRRAGLVETRRGSGTWPTGELPPTLQQTTYIRQSPSELAQSLRDQIRDGAYATGAALPSAKSLGNSWNRHPQTVARILDTLVASGDLERAGRFWKVPRPRSTKSAPPRHRILLVGASDEQGALRMDSDREIEFWRDITLEASRNGLETVRIPWQNGNIEVPTGTLGMIVSTWHILNVQELLMETVKTRLPVCTWLEGMDGLGNAALSAHPRLFVHEVAHSKRAGEDMAQHLIHRRFARVAWINPFRLAHWSQLREAGLRTKLHEAGIECMSFGIDALTEWDFLTPAWSDPALWNTISPHAIDTLTEGRSRIVVAKAAEQLGLARMTRAWSASLEEALEWNPDVWVASNDLVAVQAKDWLVRRGAWKAGKTALAGFDDSSDALRQDLTSYRFDTTAMSRSMILQILSWRKDRRRTGRLTRHGGAVIARGSTA
jgi:DNA-binding transcriptional regulator YhcF (GntR family)